MSYDKNWFQLVLNIRASVIRDIKYQIIIIMIVSLIITFLYEKGHREFSQPSLSGLIPGIVLGLLLVFRTNTAYERFWEGWKSSGMAIFTGRNLSRQIWINIITRNIEDKENKAYHLRLISAFFLAMIQHLRKEGIDNRLKSLLTPEHYLELENASERPIKIIQWIGVYLAKQYNLQNIDSVQLAAMNKFLDQLVECLSGCDRILNAPMPISYSIHLRHLLFLYCFVLPFQMVKDLHWLTAIATSTVAFALFGIEAIGLEIENPFGYDANDIPLDKLSYKLYNSIEDLIATDETLMPLSLGYLETETIQGEEMSRNQEWSQRHSADRHESE